jgi:LacI family transcriptional regulator
MLPELNPLSFMASTPVTTLADLATAAGLSRAAVSYALRGHPSVSQETSERVRRLAEAIGYRADPRVSSLMAHIRRRRQPQSREPLAFVWVSTRKGERFPAYHRHYLQTILRGADARAAQLGCKLAEFWLDDPDMNRPRLANILRTRGITGVVFSPAMHDLAVELDWPWDNFSCAIIGNTEWAPALHRVGHYHYRSMWRTLQHLREEGYTRPAAILSRSIHDRVHGAQVAAFQANHPCPDLAPNLVQLALAEDYSGLRRWPGQLKTDALIVGWPVDAAAVKSLRTYAPTARRIVTLDWQPTGALPGMDVRNEAIAASAVDLVVAQLHRNERGVPEHPNSLLLDGTWRDSPAAPNSSELAEGAR